VTVFVVHLDPVSPDPVPVSHQVVETLVGPPSVAPIAVPALSRVTTEAFGTGSV
jgi:hypothetical protein